MQLKINGVTYEFKSPSDINQVDKVERIYLKYTTELPHILYDIRSYSPFHHIFIEVPNEYLDYAFKESFPFMYFNIFFIPEKPDESFYARLFSLYKMYMIQSRWGLFSYVYFNKKPINSLEFNDKKISIDKSICEGCPLKETGCTPEHIFSATLSEPSPLCSFIKKNYQELEDISAKSIRLFMKKNKLDTIARSLFDPFNILDINYDEGNFIVFLPSYSCKTDCDYCYLGDKIKIEDKADLRNAYSYLRKFKPFSYVVFHGGEPTLQSPDYYRSIINRFPTMSFSIQTNLLCDIEKWESLFKNELDGNISTSYVDKYRKGRKLWWKNMQHLKEKGVKPFVIAVYYDGLNAKELYNELKEFPFRVNPMYQSDKAKSLKENNKGYGKFLIELTKLWLEDENNFNTVNPSKEIIYGFLNNKGTKCPFMTDCHKGTYAVDYKGDVFLGCGYDFKDEVKLGNIKDGLTKLKTTDLYKTANKRKIEIYSKECKDCKYLFVCQGGCPMHSYYSKGNLLAKTDICEEYYEYYEFLDEYLKNFDIDYLNKKVKDPFNISDLPKGEF